MHDPFIGGLRHALALQAGATSFLHEYCLRTGFRSFDLTLPGSKRFLVLLEEEDRRCVLKDQWQSFPKNSPQLGIDLFFEELLGRGIFGVDGPEWQHQRKMKSHLFSTLAMKQQMEHVFVTHGKKLVSILRQAAETKAVVDLQNIMQCFTFDATCEIVSGTNPGALEAASRGEKLEFLVSFDAAQAICFGRTVQPSMTTWNIFRWLNIGQEAEMQRHTRVLRDYVQAIIDSYKQSQH